MSRFRIYTRQPGVRWGFKYSKTWVGATRIANARLAEIAKSDSYAPYGGRGGDILIQSTEDDPKRGQYAIWETLTTIQIPVSQRSS